MFRFTIPLPQGRGCGRLELIRVGTQIFKEDTSDMIEYSIIKLQESPEIKDTLAAWLHAKWGVPLDAYLDSMNACLSNRSAVPQWYGVVANHRMIAGLGVIANDFHDRKDLAPNVCAIYVEEDYRGRGIAGEMLGFVCRDMKNRGIDTLYLVTDHTSFYERYGWELLCMVQGDDEPEMARMYVHRAT